MDGCRVTIGNLVLGEPWTESGDIGDANPVQIQYFKRFNIINEECIPQRKVAVGQNWGLWEITITLETITPTTKALLMQMLDTIGAGPYLVVTDGIGEREMVFEDVSFSQKGGESGSSFYWTIKLIEYNP